ncbi:MAG: hypothetical protein PHE76_02605, partial [Candidatus Pacebacteria bacterium]|nr:hypothetical protein [Candidatus Paceibacterota bacterium]
FLEMEKAPAHPLYNGGTHLTTNECFLYFSDGEHYSIRVPTVGNKGYLIQESRNPNPQGIQEKCEEGWIPFGNRCVMKYEAKYDSTAKKAVSKATSIPWTKETAGTEVEDYLTWYKAKEECEKIGAHLITNAEWMALARDIESVDENWVGTGTDRALKMGNTGNAAPVNSDAWYALDSADYVGHPDPNDKADRSSTSSAKLILSNGQVIWDLSGNVSEWVDKIISTQKGLIGSGNYVEINSIDWANLTNMHISYSQIGPLDKNGDNFTSSNGIGTICLSSSEGCFALARGATHINKKNTGVFTFYFKDLPSTSLDTRGFRCVR